MATYWRENGDGTKTAYVDITVPGAKRVRESTGIRSDRRGAKRLAQEYHDTRTTEIWRQVKLGEKPRRTWEEAVIRWLDEHQHKKSLDKDIQMLAWMDPHMRGVLLDTIDRDFVEEVIAMKAAEGVSDARLNRYTAVIRAILNAAEREWRWIDSAPALRMRRETNDRISWMTREEAEMLLEELAGTAPHLRDAAEFSLHTGLRDSNVRQLRWEQIDIRRRSMHVYETKNGRPLGTPLNSAAMSVLERRLGIDSAWVFAWRGKPVSRFNNSAWRKALTRTLARIEEQHGELPERLEGFTWHSLRHTWATWMVMAGCPLEQLMRLGGWRTMSMVLRYAHMSTAHLAPYSELIAPQAGRLKAVK